MFIRNTIIRDNLVIVDAKITGLAGCASSDSCPRAANCLRADPIHNYRVEPMGAGAACQVFIPVALLEALT